MRNPGCQLENVPYTETHYAPADISDTSGDTKYRNSLTATRFQPYASTWQEPLPSTDVGPITNATSKHRSLDLGRIRPSLFRGMWAAPSRLTEKLDGETRGGTQEVGGPFSASRNTSHDKCHGSFSSSILPFPPRSLTSPPERNDNAKLR